MLAEMLRRACPQPCATAQQPTPSNGTIRLTIKPLNHLTLQAICRQSTHFHQVLCLISVLCIA